MLTSATALAVATGATTAAAPTEPPGKAGSAANVPAISVKNGATTFGLLDRNGARVLVQAQRDTSVAPKARPDEVKMVGEIDGGATVILADSYPSLPGGLHHCQAGHERFLRVISLSRVPPRETLRLKLESCLDNIELLTPGGLTWDPKSGVLHVAWLLGPSVEGRPETLDLSISAGTVAPADLGNRERSSTRRGIVVPPNP
jgi:hypothetical protein